MAFSTGPRVLALPLPPSALAASAEFPITPRVFICCFPVRYNTRGRRSAPPECHRNSLALDDISAANSGSTPFDKIAAGRIRQHNTSRWRKFDGYHYYEFIAARGTSRRARIRSPQLPWDDDAYRALYRSQGAPMRAMYILVHKPAGFTISLFEKERDASEFERYENDVTKKEDGRLSRHARWATAQFQSRWVIRYIFPLFSLIFRRWWYMRHCC